MKPRMPQCLVLAASLAGAQTVVNLDPAKTRQDFEGWGASLCWWGNQVGRWSDANLARLIGMVADPDTGLGYTLFRYNIGGGDQPGHTHLAQFKALPGYKPTEAGPYDWSADPYQRKVAAMLQKRGRNVVFEAFSNSPPWWMTKSKCSGGMSDGSDNLNPDHFEAFAGYLADVSGFLRDSAGLAIRTIAPFNEPSSNWWTGTNKEQEGCGFTQNQGRLVKLLGNTLRRKNLAIGISAADETSIALAVSGLQKYDDSAMAFLSQLNTHSYSGWERREAFAALGPLHKKRLWASESGPLHRPAGGNQLDVSLWMADVIIRDIREMQVNAWLDWQVVDASAAWRSLDVNQTAQTFVPNKRFYMHRNFSNFIRPGSKILATDAENILAALVPETGNLVVVILNPDNAARTYALELAKFPKAASGAVYSTSSADNLRRLADVSVSGNRIAATVAPKSLATFAIRVADPTSIASLPEKESMIGRGGNRYGNAVLYHSGPRRLYFDARGRMSERLLPPP